MSENIIKHAIKTAGTLTAFALVGTAILAYIFIITRAPIEASEAEARLALFAQILPHDTYNNDLLKSELTIPPNALLGNHVPSKANIAKLGDKTVGVILEAIAHDGYAGDIKLLLAIRADGSISGVRVLTHKETPGLGDYIEIERNAWITQFSNESLAKTAAKDWAVTKDGGKFEYMAGATITPRAIVKAAAKALQFFNENKPLLLENKTTDNMPPSKDAKHEHKAQSQSKVAK
ncbi:electron transport complex subunit RsxG [Methylotenera mobilis]|uniref:Ion-translocating oxidoreductase complex subunit G n=1 Tax=Methylotenera mobilis (strain JLW8 / ATCC BAA-1282 / DSM 17540) TaxID=583345 RepID=C6WYE2_METML|nr:electron transport complex subunit RsxG [Methylotenera mobilis]ACT48861.1 electron transport complex, RnfABCDGE type, G subunit [Methylotenera mobilis JLW8]